jgi:hypothetical protein
VRLLAVILLSQLVLVSVASRLQAAMPYIARGSSGGVASTSTTELADTQSCTSADALRSLAALPPGLVVAHTDIGAHLAVATPHRALSGPYHRIPGAIIANHAIWSARDAATAGRELAKVGADYVLTCRPYDAAMLAAAQWKGTLVDDLAAGRVPPFLVPLPLDSAAPFRMWRVDRSLLPTN